MPPTKTRSSAQFVPEIKTLRSLQDSIQACRGCDLYKHATQAVFGDGPTKSRVVFVGEQPGNEEDRMGEPFVGPAGKLLDRAFSEAGIDRSHVYVTNIVKHFKFEERGKRRMHKKPNATEVQACRPWLEAEIALIKPKLLVCLGATAAQALLGREHRLTVEHGSFFEHPLGLDVMSTIHPSSILRAPSHDQRESQYQQLVDDLKKVGQRLSRS